MTVTDLRAKPLTLAHAIDLSKRVREADLRDMKNQEATVLECLMVGLDDGEAWGVWDGTELIGAGGYTYAGTVWSLWTDLSPEQSRGVMAKAVDWAKVLRLRAGKLHLWNVYTEGNRVTEAFLKATHCITIQDDTPLTYRGRSFIPFFLKPFSELPAHV